MVQEAALTKKYVRENKRIFSQTSVGFEIFILAGFDIVALIAAAYITIALTSYLGYSSVNIYSSIILFAVFIFISVLIGKLVGLYRFKVSVSSVQRIPEIVISLSISMVLTIAISFLFLSDINIIRILVFFWFIAAGASFVFKVFGRFLIGWRRNRGIGLRNVLIMGAGKVGNNVAKKLKENPYLGFRPIGFIDGNPLPLEEKQQLNILGKEKDLREVIKNYNVEHVIVCFSTGSHKLPLKIIRMCQVNGVTFSIVPRLFETISDFDSIDAIQSVPILTLKKTKTNWSKLAVKRVMDIVGSLFMLTLFSPLLIVLGILIKLESRGPVYFKQVRYGKNKKPFTMLKFRSMITDAEDLQRDFYSKNEAEGPIFKIKKDPRVTKVGAFLRKYSFDEFPQFINVLKGDMSMVGPRPPIPSEVKQYSDWHLKRLTVKPGITGLWQINGRSDLSFEEMVKLDVEYIENYSIWLDITLLLRTVTAVLARRGAY